MEIRERYFFLEQEPCVIHLPEKPNGFGVLLIGDVNYSIENGTSSWVQHPGKSLLLEELRRAGYTVFSSNLYGRHWGSDKALRLAKRLYHIVMKKEILNEQIHIVAEGMGALTALELMSEMSSSIRSAVLLNPCLDLPLHIGLEREHKFFYKRLLRELQEAYGVSEEELADAVACKSYHHHPSCVPVKLFVPTHERKERKTIHRDFEAKRLQEGCDVSLSFHLQDARVKLANSIVQFFRRYEGSL
ncbi:alpha/beta hydrolase [Ectobacillus ponti]|uniref:Alpha/beta hydrolase n=1 Tax=Ectobacillus ponti TaxID=2961894 RepID=A0AA41X3J6_9BACI|nr:alpha/beta hydrolase [Ectobacillus ponti]MCP8968294.1 alpha/beta hydrolase [Ectobacillus ponti]